MTTVETDVSPRTIKGRGLTSHTLLSGSPDNPVVLLLHGSGPGANAASNWQHLMPDLAENFFVVAPDLIGFGDSEIPVPPPRDLTGWIGVRTEQILGIMETLGVDKCHVVGNSMGGALALQLLSEAPERFDKVALMGSVGGPVPKTPETTRLMSFYSDPRESRYKELMHSFAYDPETFEGMDDLITQRYKIATRPDVMSSAEGMIATMNDGLDTIVMPPSVLSRLPHDVLIFHGRQDNIVPLEPSLYFLKHLKRASLFVIDKSGHWAQLQRWDIMRPLLERHFGAKSWDS
jgi:2-hydroxymuconate-semialdehyde hydrolase